MFPTFYLIIIINRIHSDLIEYVGYCIPGDVFCNVQRNMFSKSQSQHGVMDCVLVQMWRSGVSALTLCRCCDLMQCMAPGRLSPAPAAQPQLDPENTQTFQKIYFTRVT